MVMNTPARTYASTERYLLPDDAPERKRYVEVHTADKLPVHAKDDSLEAQYKAVKSVFGEKLVYPPIDTASSTFAALDAATGSGIWLVDIAAHAPQGRFVGIDISPRLFPQHAPTNVSFDLASVLDLPTEFSGSFDLVNQRLLIFALRADEWQLALQGAWRALRPGGWIQLLETHPDGWPKNGRAAQKVRRVWEKLASARGMAYKPQEAIVPALAEVGFQNIVTDERTEPLGRWAGITGDQGRDNIQNAFKSIEPAVTASDGLGLVSSREEYVSLVDEMASEFDENEGSIQFWTAIYAQKPLTA